MLKQTHHFSPSAKECPVVETSMRNPHDYIMPGDVKRYAVKCDPQIHDIFVRLGCAVVANGGAVNAERLLISTVEIARASATAGFADCEIDVRTDEDLAKEREAAREAAEAEARRAEAQRKMHAAAAKR